MVRIVLTGGSRTADEIVAGIPAATGGVWHPRPDIVLTVLAGMTAAGEVIRDGDRHRLRP